MTRTQITLEEDEYLFLKAQAAESGTSLSSVVRSLVRSRMGQTPPAVLHIWELAGLISDIEHGGRHHDEIIAEAMLAEMGIKKDDSA